MSSAPTIRDPLPDHLITPQNSTLLLAAYQPSQFSDIRSMDTGLLLKNVVSTVKTARAFKLPIVHSTVNVAAGQGYTVPELAELLQDNPASFEAHRAGLERVLQAGAQPISWVSLACELHRDWARQETMADIFQIVLTERLQQE